MYSTKQRANLQHLSHVTKYLTNKKFAAPVLDQFHPPAAPPRLVTSNHHCRRRRRSGGADAQQVIAIGGYGRPVVSYDDHGGVGAVGGEALHQGSGGVGIERAVKLIEQQNRSGPQQGARYGNALGLPLAESAAGLVAGGVEPQGEVKHEIGGGRVEHAGQLLVGGPGGGKE